MESINFVNYRQDYTNKTGLSLQKFSNDTDNKELFESKFKELSDLLINDNFDDENETTTNIYLCEENDELHTLFKLKKISEDNVIDNLKQLELINKKKSESPIIKNLKQLLPFLGDKDQNKLKVYLKQEHSGEWTDKERSDTWNTYNKERPILEAESAINEILDRSNHSLETILYVLNHTYHLEEFLHFIALNPKILEIAKTVPLTFPDKWQSCVVRKKGFAESFYGSADQNLFGNMIYRTIQITAQLFREKYPLDEIIDFVRFRRRDVAYTNDSTYKENYGRKIILSSYAYTVLTGDYKVVEDRYMEFIKDSKNEKYFQCYSYPNKRTIDFYTFLDGERIKIHTMEYKASETQSSIFFHTKSFMQLKIMKTVENLLTNAAEMDVKDLLIDKDLLLRILAKNLYRHCMAKPYFSGEVIIADMLNRAIWEAKGLGPLPNWKEDIIPWVEAVTELDENAFIEKFPSFLEWRK